MLAEAAPSGTVTADAFDRLTGLLLDGLRGAGQIDGGIAWAGSNIEHTSASRNAGLLPAFQNHRPPHSMLQPEAQNLFIVCAQNIIAFRHILVAAPLPPPVLDWRETKTRIFAKTMIFDRCSVCHPILAPV